MKQDIFDRLMGLPVLRKFYGPYQKHKQLLLYVFFGGLTTVVSIGTFMLFHDALKIDALIANILSWVFAVGFAYLTNRKWVFQSDKEGKGIWQEAVSFYAGRLLTLGIEEGLLLVFVTWLRFPGTGVKLAAQVVVLIGNYVISKWFIFKNK